MAQLPIIPNVFRITVLWNTLQGIAPRNTFHVRKTGATLAAIWANVDTAFSAPATASGLWSASAAGFTAQTCLVYDLGTTNAGEVRSLTRGFLGAGANELVPAVTPIVSIRTAQRGPRGRGRLYLPSLTEDQQNAGKLIGGALSTMGTAWAAFLASLNGNTVEFGVASYQHADFHPVTSLVVEAACATRRGRQNKIRAS